MASVLRSRGGRLGTAVRHFQKLVSQRFASDEQGPLASRGRVPLAEDTQLLVTDMVRGSFVLEAAADRAQAQTSLKAVVGAVADTLSRMAARNRAPKQAYTLLDMVPVDPPASWPASKQQPL